MSPLSPIKETARGLTAYVRGVRWLRDHPRYLVYLAIPGVMGLIFLIGAGVAFVTHAPGLMNWILFAQPDVTDPYWRSVVYNVCYVLLYVAAIVLTLLSSFLLMNVVASPIYEVVSVAIERQVTGCEPAALGYLGNLRVIRTELGKMLLIVFASIILLFIPGLNVLSSLTAAFLIGWDFFDYPVARRGWSLRRRLRLVAGEFWAVFGLGLWLLIPIVQIVMLPLAVAGGTLLNLETLERERLLTPSVP